MPGRGLITVRAALSIAAVVILGALFFLTRTPQTDTPQTDTPQTGTPSGLAIAAPQHPAVPATIRWLPERVIEGTLFRIIVDGGDPAVQSAAGTFAGQPLHFDMTGDGSLEALAAAPLDSTGAVQLRVQIRHVDGSRDEQVIPLPVAVGDYRLEELTVAPQFGRPQPPEIQERIAAEARRARAVSEASHATPRLWEPPFVAPRTSRITSGFGSGRIFNGQVQSRHTGTDFAGAVGAPVHAPARGVVAIVGDFYLGGGVVYIDHGAGLVTAYLHLSEQLVAEGDTVTTGQRIGSVGATGRVTGPHLHWIVRYGGYSVDAMSLLELFSDTTSSVPSGTQR